MSYAKFPTIFYSILLGTALISGNKKEAPEIIVHTVTFNTNDGTAITPIQVIDGQTIDEPSIEISEFGVFMRWFANEDLSNEFDFSKTITSDIMLYADFAQNFEAKKKEELKN